MCGSQLQGLSERMAILKLLKLLVPGTESTIGAQICRKISIKVNIFRLALKKTLTRFGKNVNF